MFTKSLIAAGLAGLALCTQPAAASQAAQFDATEPQSGQLYNVCVRAVVHTASWHKSESSRVVPFASGTTFGHRRKPNDTQGTGLAATRIT